jgi:hypothetical protein
VRRAKSRGLKAAHPYPPSCRGEPPRTRTGNQPTVSTERDLIDKWMKRGKKHGGAEESDAGGSRTSHRHQNARTDEGGGMEPTFAGINEAAEDEEDYGHYVEPDPRKTPS